MKKTVLTLAILFGLLHVSYAQQAIEPILADAFTSPQVQKIFSGQRYYVILANEIVNQENCNLSMLRLDRPIRFWENQRPPEDGTYYMEAKDCVLILDIKYDPLKGYRVLMQDMNTGMNVFLAKSAF